MLAAVLRTAQFVVADAAFAHRPLAFYAAGPGDFSDYLVAEQAAAAGCAKVATVDRKILHDTRFMAP